MNRHFSNELLNEVSKRAVWVAMQTASGQRPLSIDDFGDNTVRGSTLALMEVGKKGFAITVSEIDKAVCDNMMGTIKNGAASPIRHVAMSSIPATPITECAEGSNSYAFVYNNDLSAVDFVFEEDDTPCVGENCGSSSTATQASTYYTCYWDGYCWNRGSIYRVEPGQDPVFVSHAFCTDGATAASYYGLHNEYCFASDYVYFASGDDAYCGHAHVSGNMPFNGAVMSECHFN